MVIKAVHGLRKTNETTIDYMLLCKTEPSKLRLDTHYVTANKIQV